MALLVGLPLFRTRIYEVFLKSHLGMAVFAVYALWRHLTVPRDFAQYYIITSACLLATTTVLHSIRLLFRNIVWQKKCARALVVPRDDAAQVIICLPRPWKVIAGQYINLCVPSVSPWSFLQNHPFMITWWDDNQQGEAPYVSLLIKTRSGFTGKLFGLDGWRLAWIDGLYGLGKDVGDYGSLFMLATGIRVAEQIPYIKQLLKGYRDCTVRTRSISLVWQIDKECMWSRHLNVWSVMLIVWPFS